MISAESYTKDWIFSHRRHDGQEKIDPQLTEKMIHALGLVELLAAAGLDFVFKGGTSLILLLPSAGRFSIDIDIITLASRAELEEVLRRVSNGKPFKDFQLNARRSYQPGIPKAHYAMMYDSSLSGKEEHILLDILYDQHPYPALFTVSVNSRWLLTEGEGAPIKVPTHESITGDKLTAFAPHTTGILYGRGKELEIIKQLHDLGKLFHEIKDLLVVGEAFARAVRKEITYRMEKCSPQDVITDIIQTGLLIAKRGSKKEEPYISEFVEMRRGLLQFKSYQMGGFFRIDEAIVAGSKAALLAASIQSGRQGPVELFDPSLKKENMLIERPEYNFLNKLPAEALFYWYKALQILQL